MLGEFTLFSWKSKKAQAAEMDAYEKWAFPHGEKHRERLMTLLADVYPKQDKAVSLVTFLTCKELFEQIYKTRGNEDDVTHHMISEVIKYKKVIRKGEMPLLVALVLAERRITETLEYPPAAEIVKHASALETLHKRA